MNALFNRAGWLLWGAAALLIVVFVYGSHHYSISGDVGWHYALVEHFLSNGALPAHLSGHLGPMRSYPPAAHAGVAALSNLTGVAPLQIMFVSALVIPMISYLLVARLALARDVGQDFAFLVCLVAMLVLFVFTRQLHGRETVHTFYFAQSIGDAACVVTFVLISNLNRLWLRVFATVVSVFAIGWLYNLSAIRLGAAILLLQAVETALAADKGVRLSVLAIATTLVLGAIFLHPTFAAMVGNASYSAGAGGGAALGTVALATAVVVAGCALLRHWLKGGGTWGQAKLGVLGIALAVTAWGQFLALYGLGMGSAYAVKKHSLLLGTALCFATAILAGERLAHARPFFRVPFWRPATPAIAVLLAAVIILPWGGYPDRALLDYDAAVRSVVARSPGDLMGKTGSLETGIWPTMNFAIATALLGMDGWSENGVDQFALIGIGQPTGTLSYILSRQSGADGCMVRRYEPENLYLLHRRCVVSLSPGAKPTSYH